MIKLSIPSWVCLVLLFLGLFGTFFFGSAVPLLGLWYFIFIVIPILIAWPIILFIQKKIDQNAERATALTTYNKATKTILILLGIVLVILICIGLLR